MAALIAYRNLFDGLTLEVGPGSTHNMGIEEVAGYPVTNVKTRQLGQVARYRSNDSDPGNWCWLTFDVSGAAAKANMVAVIGRDAPAYINVTGSLDGGSIAGSVVYVSGRTPELPPLAVYRIPASYGDISLIALEAGNVPAPDYLELSRIFVARAITLPDGVDGRWSLGADDAGWLDKSRGQQYFEAAGVVTRRLNVSIPQMDSMTAFGIAENATVEPVDQVPSIQDMQMEAGTTGEVVVVPRGDSAVWTRRLGIYGHLDRVPVIQKEAGPNWSTSFTVIEER